MSDKPKWWPKNPLMHGDDQRAGWEFASNAIWSALQKNIGADEVMMATILQAVDEALDGQSPSDFMMSFPIVRKAYETSEAACGSRWRNE